MPSSSGQGVELVPQDSQLFREALTLYRDRPDKHWSLTDCASFLIMQQRGSPLKPCASTSILSNTAFCALLRG